MNKLAVFSVAGAGVVGAGGIGMYTLLKETPSIHFSQRINTSKRVILDTETNAHGAVWVQIAEEYKQNGNIREIPKDTNIEESLKQYCRKNKTSNSKNSEEFEQYKRYCTRENLMTKLSVGGKSWNISNDESKWAESERIYKALTGSTEGLLIPKSSGGDISILEVTNRNIMDHCKEISVKPFIKNTDADYKRGEKWCLV